MLAVFVLWDKDKKLGRRLERAKHVRSFNHVRHPNQFHVQMKRDKYFAERLILRDDSVVGNIFPSRNNSSNALPLQAEAEAEAVHGEGLGDDNVENLVVGDLNNVNVFFGVNFNQFSSLSFPPSVLSITESVVLAKAKATNFIRRSIISGRERDRSVLMKKMAPALHKLHNCKAGCKHNGKIRMIYDPLTRQWWGWWTCCGLGELAIDIRYGKNSTF